MQTTPSGWRTIGILATTQVMSWGSLYYAFAILAPEIRSELGWRAESVFGAFSWSLLVAGFASTPTGILLDRYGGRLVMGTGSLTCGVGLILLSQSHGLLTYVLAWTLLGLAMALTLYEAAFATINKEFGLAGRKAISTLTLFGGFASTVFWPLTQLFNAHWGWRTTYLVYGLAQLLVCLPLHLLLPSPRSKHDNPVSPHAKAVQHYSLREAVSHPAFWKLALAFSANSFVFSAMSVHLIPLLKQLGHKLDFAVMMAALIGPAQVLGRIGEMTFAKRASPQTTGLFCFTLLPLAMLALMLLGSYSAMVALFCLMYGLSNGIVTIVRGTIPQALFGSQNYGAISGALAGPALLSKAAGPLVIAALVQFSPTPGPVLGLLLAFAVLSLCFYLAAVNHDQTAAQAKPS
ncbi:MFS transporter [Undibacterium sp. TS12]|uniref:MFS transporter n=1 Tax=Undibacterium sp. TS12 TaxID=2908202 RepID=UPI001F4CE14D|nr:MFS transporter [Undibacterium sp. TS12]MCH8622803.1 MFS transporter [Undibacterium sp. TS12]